MDHPKLLMVRSPTVTRFGWAIAPLLLGAVAAVMVSSRAEGQVFASAAGVPHPNATLWTNPTDIKERNLFYGPGGAEGQPRAPLTFLKEDNKTGTNPKFWVRDAAGRKWKAKLGIEAQPETVAARLLWAVGYGANQNFFLADTKIDNMPRLKRGHKLVGPDGKIRAMRLQRPPRGAGKKIGIWHWKRNPFNGSRELNGLRVMMALLNNWDLKDDNNAIYAQDDDSGTVLYEVSDVGASFGMTGEGITANRSKNNLSAYRRSKLIAKITPDSVSFHVPSHLTYWYVFRLRLFMHEGRMRWIGQRIPRSDVKWITSLLAQLSPAQIRDAFRSAGYSPDQVEAYATALEARIAELQRL